MASSSFLLFFVRCTYPVTTYFTYMSVRNVQCVYAYVLFSRHYFRHRSRFIYSVDAESFQVTQFRNTSLTKCPLEEKREKESK